MATFDSMDFVATKSSIYTLFDAKKFLTNLSIIEEDSTDTLKETQTIDIMTKLTPQTVNPALLFST